MEQFKQIGQIMTKLLVYGPKVGDMLKDVNYLVILIPGNPGIIEFYREFLDQLFLELSDNYPTETAIPVWGISHAGHDIEGIETPFPSLKENSDLYSLEGQIKHKEKFINEFVPNHVKVILIGHSIGCHIGLEAIKRLPDFANKIYNFHMLFPAIQRMRESPSGKFYVRFPKWFLLGILRLFEWTPVPDWMTSSYISVFQRNTLPCVQTGIRILSKSTVLEKVFTMADSEMDEVYDLDIPTIGNNLDLLEFYFGNTDAWCPRDFVDLMRIEFPRLKYKIYDLEHAFVIQSSRPMASIVASKILNSFRST